MHGCFSANMQHCFLQHPYESTLVDELKCHVPDVCHGIIAAFLYDGHWYQFFSAGLPWATARTTALSKSYNGSNGPNFALSKSMYCEGFTLHCCVCMDVCRIPGNNHEP